MSRNQHGMKALRIIGWSEQKFCGIEINHPIIFHMKFIGFMIELLTII